MNKPVIGISCGDINGIGPELIIKTFADARLLDICTPVVFANHKLLNFYRKGMQEEPLNFFYTKDLQKINPKQLTIINCWEEEVNIMPGVLNEAGGRYAILSLEAAVQALKEGHIHGLVTAPIHKSNVQSGAFRFSGHTPYLKQAFGADDVVMLLCAENMRVALVTEHVPVKDIAAHLSIETILRKLKILHASLQKDFGIDKPKIAVLGLNPHAGDEGLVGNEEQTVIKPAVDKARAAGMLAFGPYSADAFFARGQYEKFDAVLAMYHDQGLIPFKSLALGEGVNYTAGLPVVRTSPDHGVAFDIAGKNNADHHSFLQSVYSCIDIIHQRIGYEQNRAHPLKKLAPDVVSKLEDERLPD